MTRVRLELSEIQIHRPKARWQLYFLLVTDHPAQQDSLVVTAHPGRPVVVAPEQQNRVSFEPVGKGTEGLSLLSRELPTSGELNAHLFVMHSRRPGREFGKMLQQLGEMLGSEVIGKETQILGLTTPWLPVAKATLPQLGKFIGGLPDRNLGFINMFERFGPEFDEETKLSREIRGGHVTVRYHWSVRH